VTNYVSRKCLFYGVCEFFFLLDFCTCHLFATYFGKLPLTLPLALLQAALFYFQKKVLGNRFTVSRLRFLKNMAVNITRCSYTGMSHIT
ncbi:MAG: hypothetical protein IJX24_03825, partial [Oscillospiraceae bacterium]|nr:hypothetical protein [Oscillospiraceae bacterium]